MNLKGMSDSGEPLGVEPSKYLPILGERAGKILFEGNPSNGKRRSQKYRAISLRSPSPNACPTCRGLGNGSSEGRNPRWDRRRFSQGPRDIMYLWNSICGKFIWGIPILRFIFSAPDMPVEFGNSLGWKKIPFNMGDLCKGMDGAK